MWSTCVWFVLAPFLRLLWEIAPRQDRGSKTGGCSVAKSCPTPCDPTDCSMSGSSVLHCLLEFAQTHMHGIWPGTHHFPSVMLINWKRLLPQIHKFYSINNSVCRTSLAVQWLRFCLPMPGTWGSIPGQGIEILRAPAVWPINKFLKKISKAYT